MENISYSEKRIKKEKNTHTLINDVVVVVDGSNVLNLIKMCDDLIESTITLQKHNADKNIGDVIVSLKQAKMSLNLV